MFCFHGLQECFVLHPSPRAKRCHLKHLNQDAIVRIVPTSKHCICRMDSGLQIFIPWVDAGYLTHQLLHRDNARQLASAFHQSLDDFLLPLPPIFSDNVEP